MEKSITAILDEDTHKEFKKTCANEKTYMRNKVVELIRAYIKNVAETRNSLRK